MSDGAGERRAGLRWKPRSLRSRVLGAMLLIGLLPVLALGGYGFLMERRRAIAIELNRLSEESQRLAMTIDRRLAANLNLARHLALSGDVTAFLERVPRDLEPMNAWLRKHAGLVKGVDAVFLLRPDGVCVASSELSFLGGDYSFRDYYRDAMEGRYRLTDWQIGLKSGMPCVFIAQAVRRQGRLLGVVVTRLDASWIQKWIEAHGREDRVAFLINPDGIILAHSRPQLVYSSIRPLPPQRLQELRSTQQFTGKEHPLASTFKERSVQAVLRVIDTGAPHQARYLSADGTMRWVALRRLTEEPWAIGIASSERAILAHSRNLLLWSVSVGILIVALIVAAGFWFARRILKPLGRLESLMDRFAAGDPSVRASEAGEDEVGRLGRHFNEMAGTIQEQTEALSRRVDTLEGILPICASCHKIRNEEGVYEPVESYISTRSSATFTHGICEDCARRIYPELHGPDGKRKIPRREP